MFIRKKFMQNDVERKVNELVKVHEKRLKLKALENPTNCKGQLQRTSFSLPETKFFAVS